jgi:hypothetical protein
MMWRVVLWVVVGAVLGYLVGGLLAASFFLAFLYDAPPGGTGNARLQYGWFGGGGLVGAVLGVGYGWRRRGRHRPTANAAPPGRSSKPT